MPYRDVITSIKQSIIDQNLYNKQLNKYKKAEILLIDDLFKGKINKTDINIIFEIINYRYLNNLPVIICSEITIDKMLILMKQLEVEYMKCVKIYSSNRRQRK